MSIVDRVLLILLALGGICAGVFAVALGSGWLGAWSMTPFGDFGAYPFNLTAIVIGIILILIALRFFAYRLGGQQVDYVVLNGEHGNIRISYETIRQLSNRTGKSIRGVQDFDTRVRAGTEPASVVLFTKIRAIHDVDLSAMGSDAQASVKEYVEKSTGVRVDQVLVNIVNVANQAIKGSKAWVD